MLNFFRIEKDRSIEGNKVALLLFNDPMKAGHSAFLRGRYRFFSRYCACTTCIAGQNFSFKVRLGRADSGGLSVTTSYSPLDWAFVSLRFVFIIANCVCT